MITISNLKERLLMVGVQEKGKAGEWQYNQLKME